MQRYHGSSKGITMQAGLSFRTGSRCATQEYKRGSKGYTEANSVLNEYREALVFDVAYHVTELPARQRTGTFVFLYAAIYDGEDHNA